VDVVATAERLAEEVLLPAALGTDRADSAPVELFDALAQAGLYGLSGPAAAGGLEADLETTVPCAAVAIAAGGDVSAGAVSAIAYGL
jgi:alkylation response protein AidB-like acyl-CoA dehydrogenase